MLSAVRSRVSPDIHLAHFFTSFKTELWYHRFWEVFHDFLLTKINSFFLQVAAAATKSLQSCLTLCNPIDGSLPGSSVPGILQARTLEWVAISFSNARKWKVKVKLLSRVWLLATPWTVAYQAPPSMGFSRQEYWSGVPLPSLGTRSSGMQNRNVFLSLGCLFKSENISRIADY